MKPIKNLWYPKPIVSLLRATFGVFLKKYYNIEFIDPENIKKLKGPYVIIGNHVNFWDPFFLSDYLTQEIHYITSDNIFRDPIFKYFMKLFGSIPKSKFIPDIQTIKLAMKVIEKGASVGLFPEANRTWDGNNLSIVSSTGKLVKFFGLPLIGAKIKGAYLSLPRWAEKKRKGKVAIEFSTILQKEEVLSLTSEQINEAITKWLKHSDDEFEEKFKYKYVGENLAQFLEQILYICPNCKSLLSIYSEGDYVKCQECNLNLKYNEYGQFEGENIDNNFNNVSKWNRWQIKYSFELIKDLFSKKIEKDHLVLQDPEIAQAHIGYRYDKTKFLGEGYIKLKKEYFEIYSKQENKLLYSFSISKMEGINVQNKEVLEFYYDNKLYRVFYENKRASTYKWMILLLIIKKFLLIEKDLGNKISKVNIDAMFGQII
jgi:1-acyl-sn-glycerol-3-phosphate acyltransferase